MLFKVFYQCLSELSTQAARPSTSTPNELRTRLSDPVPDIVGDKELAWATTPSTRRGAPAAELGRARGCRRGPETSGASC